MGCRGCYGKIAIAAAAARRDGQPKAQPDGSLIYPRIAPLIPGYQRDHNNPQRLVPTHPPCKMRLCTLYLKQDGSYEVWQKCNEPQHPKRMETVSPQDCQDCSLRS